MTHEQLLQQYEFQTACLVMLVKRLGGSTVLTEEDIDEEGKSVSLDFRMLPSGDIQISLIDTPEHCEAEQPPELSRIVLLS